MQLLSTRGHTANADRQAFISLLNNKGHWMIYRRYKRGTKSTFYSEATGEGVGGARWDYSDKPVRVRQDRASVRASAGTGTDISKIHLDWKTKPRRGDVFIEIDYDGDNRLLTPGLIMQMDHRQAYEITDLAAYRGSNGIIIYYTCIVKPEFEEY